MREKHPIDELFRDSLANAEATPPPGIWQGILEARRNRRKFPPWFRLNGLLLLLIPAAGLLAYMALPNISEKNDLIQNEEAQLAGLVDDSGSIPHTIILLDDPTDNSTMNSKGSMKENRDEPSGSRSEMLIDDIETSVVPSKDDGPLQLERTNAVIDAPVVTPEYSFPADKAKTSNTFSKPLIPGVKSEADHQRNSVARLSSLTIDYPPGSITTEPLDALSPPTYVLAKADWLFSLMAARYDVKRGWKGSDDQLVTALNNTEAHTSTYAAGVGIGRHWRSGWGLSSGVALERSEQSFEHIDKRTDVTQEVVTWMVTLDSEVFVTDVDTIEHISTSERHYSGINKRTVVRVPLYGHYQRSFGRFQFGSRVGVAMEFTTARQDHSLTLDREEGRVTAVHLDRRELQQRHPVMLMGNVGLELGYFLTEHWSAGIAPVYMTPLTPLSPTGDAWSSASRFGLEFRTSLHLTSKRK